MPSASGGHKGLETVLTSQLCYGAAGGRAQRGKKAKIGARYRKGNIKTPPRREEDLGMESRGVGGGEEAGCTEKKRRCSEPSVEATLRVTLGGGAGGRSPGADEKGKHSTEQAHHMQ